MANFCSQCGAPVEPDHMYCSYCGSPIVEANIPASQPSVEKPQPEGVPVAPVFSTGESNSQPGSQSSGSQPSVSGGMSAVSRAWQDVKVQNDLVKRGFLLSVLSCIPVVNFVVVSYIAKWGMGSAYGRHDALPKTIFGNGNFMTGFLIVVLLMVWSLVLGLVSEVPLVGVIASILAGPMMQLCVLRLAMFGTLGHGFEITKIWEAYKKSFPDVLIAFWVPSLAATVAASVLAFVATGAGVLSGVGLMSNLGFFVNSLGILGLILTFVLCFVTIAITVACELVCTRALGYYLKDNAPEWAQEAMVVNPQATQL